MFSRSPQYGCSSGSPLAPAFTSRFAMSHSRVGRLAGRADRHPSAHKSALLHLVPIHFGNQADCAVGFGQHAKNSE